MPRPTTMPAGWNLRASVQPLRQAQLKDPHGRNVSVTLMLQGKPSKAFTIFRFLDDGVEVYPQADEGFEHLSPRPFLIPWEATATWEVIPGTQVPVAKPGWLRTGQKLSYIGSDGPEVQSLSRVSLLKEACVQLDVLDTSGPYAEVAVRGISGKFKIEYTENFTQTWALVDPVSPSVPSYIRVGGRIRPATRVGLCIGPTSYQIIEVRAQTFRASPLNESGILGPALEFPLWNSYEAWAIAPDDSTQTQVLPGMMVQVGEQQFKVVSVNLEAGDVTIEKQVTERVHLKHLQVLTPPETAEVISRYNREGE